MSPSNVTVVSKSTTSVTISWTYNDISDADGYVIYVNDSAIYNVIGGANTSVTLHGLIPGTNNSIIVRAYQDILGPPSIPLIVASGNDGKYQLHITYYYRVNSSCYHYKYC